MKRMTLRFLAPPLLAVAVLALNGCNGGNDASLVDASSPPPGNQKAAPGSQTSAQAKSNAQKLLSGIGLTGPRLPATDLQPLLSGLLTTDTTNTLKPVVLNKDHKVPLKPVPRAECNNQSRPLHAPGEGVQGRVTLKDIQSPGAKDGWTCNLSLVSHYYNGTPGGFRVWRYTDEQGNTCAYYDTSFAGGPLAIISFLGGPSYGVAVLDMNDPAHPVRTDTLRSLAMLAPHESLNLNRKRGLLAAEVGSALTLPGTLAIYAVSQDCQHPKLLGTAVTVMGHESGFSPDGNTFWVAGGVGTIQAFDVSDPSHPKQIWSGQYYAHGLNFTSDGNIMFQTSTLNGNVGLLDVSEVQNRKPDPHVYDISRITWPTVSIPQNTNPFHANGHHYLLEYDEFAFRFNPLTADDQVGAARIINIDDPKHPFLVSNIRLEVNMKAKHQKASGDPAPVPPLKLLGYAFHYCNIPTRDNPQIIACSALESGLRIFNISDVHHPREVAYYIAPPAAGKPLAKLLPANNGLTKVLDTVTGDLLGIFSGDLSLQGNIAFSQPAFYPEGCQVWYTDGESGFYALKLSKQAWPTCYN